ncbi:MAG: hypothetical protein ABSE69_14650 [Roseiarcus sp.]
MDNALIARQQGGVGHPGPLFALRALSDGWVSRKGLYGTGAGKGALSRRPTSADDSDRWNEGRPIVARGASCRAAHLAIAIGRIGGNVDEVFWMGYCAREGCALHTANADVAKVRRSMK